MLSPGVHVQEEGAWWAWRGGQVTFNLPSDPAASILALVPREGLESAAGQDKLPDSGRPPPAPLSRTSASGRCGSATVWPHDIKAPPLRAPGSAAAWPLLRPAGREREGRGVSQHSRTPVFLHIHPSWSCLHHQIQSGRSRGGAPS